MEGQNYSTWEYDPAQQHLIQRPSDLQKSLMSQNLRGFDSFSMSGFEYMAEGTTTDTDLDFPLVQTKEWDLMPIQLTTFQGTPTKCSDPRNTPSSSNVSGAFSFGGYRDLLTRSPSTLIYNSNSSSTAIRAIPMSKESSDWSIESDESLASFQSISDPPSFASLTSTSSSSMPSSPFIDHFSGSSEVQLPKAPRVSRAFKCWVDSCLDSIAGFATLKDRKRHYEIEHPDQILGCRITGCKYQSFLKERDRAKHETRMHATSKIEEALETDMLPEVILDVTQGVGCKNSSSDALCDKKGSLGSVESSPKQQSTSKLSSNLASSKASSTCSDPSAGFETDSTWSEESDWEEHSSPQDHSLSEFFDMGHGELLSPSLEETEVLIRPSLTPMKQALVDSIMREFWTIFNQEWSANIRKCADDLSSSTSFSGSESKSTGEKSPGRKDQKRGRGDDGDDDPDENNGRNPKRQKPNSSPTKDADEGLKFACPYRKHNPRKYYHGNRSWRSCALTPLENISRVKGHLYRYHRIFQCQRCKELFKDPEALERHFLETKSCELNPAEPAEGITGNLEKRLRSRKKTYRDQSESERWQEIYRILFPTEEVPSPYFEAIQDDIIRSPDSEELANYEQYSRRELPRFFRSALEAAIADEAQPIEERLRSRLVGMIQDCQDRVFSTYKSRRGSGTPSSNVVAENTSLEQLSSPLPMRHGKASIPEGTDNATGILETFYERPPPQIHVQPYSDVVLGSSIPNAIELNTSTNLGCASDLSLHNSQSLSMEQMSVSGTATASGSQTQQFPDTPQLPEDFNAGINYPFPFKNGTDGHSYSYESGNIPIPVLSMEDCCELDERLDNFDFDKWMLNAR